MTNNNLRIVFMGTPEFAVESLRALINDGQNIVGVVTNTDKPSGRGQILKPSPVKVFAQENGIEVLQPANLKSDDFISRLRGLKADLQVVVAFRILPDVIWSMPELGTFNLHASILPDYRGAAPINWAIINGETTTGVTTFFIDHDIDTGKIIFQEKVDIKMDESAGELHDKLMKTGAGLVVKTVRAISRGNYKTTDQSALTGKDGIKKAPKIYKEDCKINWSRDLPDLYNFIRGLSPYPAAWTELISAEGDLLSVKIFQSEIERTEHKLQAGKIESDDKSYLRIAVHGGYIYLTRIQIAGKNKMGIEEFLRGFKNPESYKLNMK
ncbi:MAG: methionyl-tRNA formyltransferase [Bacteroidales bacterium]|nr:MAG: methionyl-tRNA formyltransferase [Bacteroidales bacterium]